MSYLSRKDLHRLRTLINSDTESNLNKIVILSTMGILIALFINSLLIIEVMNGHQAELKNLIKSEHTILLTSYLEKYPYGN